MTEAETRATALRIAGELKDGRGSGERVLRSNMVETAARQLLEKKDAGTLTPEQAKQVEAAYRLAEKTQKQASLEERNRKAAALISKAMERTAPNKY